MPTISAAEHSRANAEKVANERPTKAKGGYARVPVFVEAFDDGKVTLRARAVDGHIRVIELPWTSDDLWAEHPSTLRLDGKGEPVVGGDGFLYLSKKIVTDHALEWDPKWPKNNADEIYRPLAIMPTSIVVKGNELQSGDYVEASVELLDPQLASPTQTLKLKGASVEVLLSEDGFNRFFVHFPTLERLRAAVTTIVGAGRRPRGAESAPPKKSSRDVQDLAAAWQVVAAWSSRLEREGGHEDERKLVERALSRL